MLERNALSVESSRESDLYFRQIAVGEMANFAYLIGSVSAREAFVVDPASVEGQRLGELRIRGQ